MTEGQGLSSGVNGEQQNAERQTTLNHNKLHRSPEAMNDSSDLANPHIASVGTIESSPTQSNKMERKSDVRAPADAGPKSAHLPSPQHRGSALNPGTFRTTYPDMTNFNLSASSARDTPRAASPYCRSSPLREPPTQAGDYEPETRQLPLRDVSDKTLDDAYVAFILYCNPVVSSLTDDTELRRGFRAPPKSDGKTFNTYTLLELIGKLEGKEIKTWTQLAIRLGVEPPVAEKGQSAQKVQQYAVRLKRWMHAMHVDAFFEYCLSKPHSYYTQIPQIHAPYPETGRDGVPLEEDLALRALHPESRPKRGRRKMEEKDDPSERGTHPAKRPHLDTSVGGLATQNFNGPHSAVYPHSTQSHSTAPVEDMDRYSEHLDPWAAASAITPISISASEGHPHSAHPVSAASGGQQFRWRLNTRHPNTPLTPNSQSAVTPSTGRPPDSGFDEPLSAITPSTPNSKGRARRRHGPAVSSAWPSSGNPITGKLRGRPPSNRSVRDGPFSTFPANPNTREGSIIDLQGSTSFSTPVSSPISGKSGAPHASQNSSLAISQGKPGGLHLHVPQHTGGIVRLATPTVVINGPLERAISSPVSSTLTGSRRSFTSTYSVGDVGVRTDNLDRLPLLETDHLGRPSPSDHRYNLHSIPDPPRKHYRTPVLIESLTHILTTKISNAKYFHDRFSHEENSLAHRLAATAINNLRRDSQQSLSSALPSSSDFSTDEAFVISLAGWLGLTAELNLFTAGAVQGVMRVMDVQPLDRSKEKTLHGTILERRGEENGKGKRDHTTPTTYRLSWRLETQLIKASCELEVDLTDQNLGTTAEFVAVKDSNIEADGEDWKGKFLMLQKETNEEVSRMKRRVLAAVL